MTLIRMLEASVAREPDAIAIVEGDERLSYGAWRAEIGRLAGGLFATGLAPGDHLVALLSNRREMASLYWACQETGIIYTPFNWRASAADAAYVLADAEAKAVVYEERSKDAVLAAAAAAGIAPQRLFNLDDAAGLPYAEPYAGGQPADDQATSLMLYTSGTTGRPKGVPRCHAAERAASLTCLAQMHYRHGEVSLGVMPLFHTMGVRALAMSAFLNGNFVCLPAFDCTEAFRLIEREKITALFLVPTMFHDMVHHAAFADFDLSSARNLGYAGMTMTSALVAQCVAKFKPEIFSNFYGSSEIYTFAVSNRLAEKPLSAGRPGMGQQLRIVRADADERVGPAEILPPGETGEIIASMSALDAFTGYWKRPDADEKAIREGWYFTGDLGRFDDEGEIAVLGRVDDMVISGGENIYPEEIEDLLAACELVRGVSVIGMADERWGQKIVAFIEPEDEGANAEALDAYCLRSGLARFKRPKDYVFIKEIPRSASGKLLRRHLRTGEYELLPGYKSTL